MRRLVLRMFFPSFVLFGLVSNVQMTASLDQVAICTRNDDRTHGFLHLNVVLERAGLPSTDGVLTFICIRSLAVLIIPLYKALDRQGLLRDLYEIRDYPAVQ